MSADPDIESDQQAGCLHPRERYDLIGHENAETALASAWESGRMHHAWLVTGPRGVGKASLVWRAARRILGAAPDPAHGPLGSDPQHPVCRQIEAQACPDLLLLRRPWDEKRKRWRAEITVEEARKAPGFFEKSSGAGGWRVCIVDCADDMNVNAANALLKTLEEPPAQGVLFLVAHSPGRLPATIRSRCRRLELRAPTTETTADWVVSQASSTDPAKAKTASEMAHGAPGRALAIAIAGGVELAREVRDFVELGVKATDVDMRKLADRISTKAGEGLRPLFYEALADSLHKRARQVAEAGGDATAWLSAWSDLNRLVREADGLYLDAKQTALSGLALARDASRKELA